MPMRQKAAGSLLCLLVLVASCGGPKSTVQGPVDDARLRDADKDEANWLMYGRTYDDHRYSPLKSVNEQTVSKLGLAWSKEMGTTRGLEATPLVKDGVIYVSGVWSTVQAFDAITGKTLWSYDPKVPRDRAFYFCCDVVNRGVALYRGKVYVGTLDGRLVALDEKTGTPVWTAQTTPDSKAYSITGAPRVARGMVMIGNAGGEYGVRGYMSAYDAQTGKMAWRVYTVPGDPSKGFESKAMEAAAKTWSGEWWKVGGGAPVWEGIVYDPELDLAYFGTGNATAWYRSLRGSGDSLYAASILAVRVSTGSMAWHFQTTPGDNWDYDATQPLVQADLKINGQARKVIMQANKNGFFYMLDRATGEFISGTAFVDGINWATGLDPKTGRPIEAPGVAGAAPAIISPDPGGAHNWNPMAFSPATGYMYLAAKTRMRMVHAPDPKWKYNPDKWNLGIDDTYDGPLYAKMFSMPPPYGELIAWDPVAKKSAWRVKYPVVEGGGVLATAGNLVMQGRADGILAAYRATDGKELWRFDAGTGIMAPPVTYTAGGEQYVTLLAGWGGAPGLMNSPGIGAVKPGYGRILTFRLGGTAILKPLPYGHKEPPDPPVTAKMNPAQIREGAVAYLGNCMICHGINAVGGSLPDLRYLDREKLDSFEDIVLGGSRVSDGMPSFAKTLNRKQVDAVKAYVIAQAQEAAKKR